MSSPLWSCSKTASKSPQRVVDLVDLGAAELAQDAFATGLVRVGGLVADADALAGESDEQRAPIVGIGQALDEAGPLQAIDDLGHAAGGAHDGVGEILR